MNGTADLLWRLLPQLAVSAPLAFAGILLMLDPAKAVGLIDQASLGLRRLQNHLQGRWADPFDLGAAREVSREGRVFVRLVGLGLVAAAFGRLLLLV